MKIIIISILTLISTVTFSQGNLQFNQVKLVSSQEKVPAGKVWKVENCTYKGGAPFSTGTALYISTPPQYNYYRGFDAIMSYSVNGNNIYIPCSFSIAGSSSPLASNGLFNFSFPFWLPAGTTLAVGTNMQYLSVIEFNILP